MHALRKSCCAELAFHTQVCPSDCPLPADLLCRAKSSRLEERGFKKGGIADDKAYTSGLRCRFVRRFEALAATAQLLHLSCKPRVPAAQLLRYPVCALSTACLPLQSFRCDQGHAQDTI